LFKQPLVERAGNKSGKTPNGGDEKVEILQQGGLEVFGLSR